MHFDQYFSHSPETDQCFSTSWIQVCFSFADWIQIRDFFRSSCCFSLPEFRIVFSAPWISLRGFLSSLDPDQCFSAPWIQIYVFPRSLDPDLFISAPSIWICIFSAPWIRIRIFRSHDPDPPWIQMGYHTIKNCIKIPNQKKSFKNNFLCVNVV